jgi:hypothetical protein
LTCTAAVAAFGDHQLGRLRWGQEKSIRDHQQKESQGFGRISGGGRGERRFEPRHCIGHPLDELLIRVVPAVRVI